MKESKAPRVTSLHRGLQILELLSGHRKYWSTSEISRKLKLPKSSSSYLLHTLESRGFVRREVDGSYCLSMKMLGLGNLAMHGLQVRDVALPILRKLVEETRIIGHLAIMDGLEAVYILRIPPAGLIQIDTWIGRRIPLYSSGAGKALLAWTPSSQIDLLFEGSELQRATSKTIVSLPKLKQELLRIQASGVSIDNEENTPGVRCVAAPIFGRDGDVEAAISQTGPLQQMSDDRLPKLAEKVKDAANQISIALGGTLPVTFRVRP